MRLILATLLFFCSQSSYSQLKVDGVLRNMSSSWENTLYIVPIDDINPISYLRVYDSISIAPNGSFRYEFEVKSEETEDLIFKVVLPPKQGNFRSVIEGVSDNYFLLTLEGNESVFIDAKADSLFYTCKVSRGYHNQSLSIFRDFKKANYFLTKKWLDSLSLNAESPHEIKYAFSRELFTLAKNNSEQIQSVLDSSYNTSIILTGLYFLYQTKLGKLDEDTIYKYTRRIKDKRYILLNNLITSLDERIANREGMILSEVILNDAYGKKVNLNYEMSNYSIINFWASWCSPCRAANRNDLPKLKTKLSGKNLAELVSISIDKDVSSWRRALSIDNPTWLNLHDNNSILREGLKLGSVPVYLIVDSNGKVIFESISIYEIEAHLTKLNAF